MQNKIKTIQELFAHAGGSMNLALALKIQQTSVIAWKYRGIPPKLWKDIIDKFPIDLDTLHAIDQKIRSRK